MGIMSLRAAEDVDLSESRQPDLYASIIICFFAAMACVLLRFWCRWVKGSGFWIDDWLILVALGCGFGLMVDQLWWMPRGLGKHVWAFGPNVVEYFYIGLFTAEMTYTGVIVFVKFSILALYWRIFKSSSSIKIPIVILGIAVLMWGLAVFFLTLLQCIPTRGFWDKSIEASCNVDSQKFLFAISIPNILIDVSLLVLPIRYVIQLNLSESQKRIIISLFLLGGFVCVASIMRLVSVVTQGTDEDITWNIVNQSIWATVEAYFAIISACLPTMRPAWVAVRAKHFTSVSTEPSSGQAGVRSRSHKRVRHLWGTSILKSAAEEDTRPLSGVYGSSVDGSRRGSSRDPQQAGSHSAIPLPNLDVSQGQAANGIKVENAWGVEYIDRPHMRDT
ncbi:integral membrane protein [Camillea tinctor]|nr:integral membrane protein [Camillea tinctor]